MKSLVLKDKMLLVKHVLGIGALGGYTSIWIASDNPDTEVTTIAFVQGGRGSGEHSTSAGLEDRVEILIGPAVDIFSSLLSDVRSGKRSHSGLHLLI